MIHRLTRPQIRTYLSQNRLNKIKPVLQQSPSTESNNQNQTKNYHSIPIDQWQKSSLDKFYRRFVPNNPFYSKGIAPNPEFARACIWFFDKYIRNRKEFNKLSRPLIEKSKINVIGYKINRNFIQIRAEYESPFRELMGLCPETRCMDEFIYPELDKGSFELILPISTEVGLCCGQTNDY